MPIARKTATSKTDDYLPKAGPDTESDEDAFEDDEDEDVTPERMSATKKGGWDAAEEVQKKVKSLGDFFQFGEEPALIAFAEGAPIDSYLLHWVDTKDGRRSFRCLDEEGDCPLCEAGDSPSAKFVFWVVEFTFKGDDIDYASKIMEVGTKLKNTLKDMNADPRKGGPLEGNFFSAHRTGKKQSTQYHISRVKDRDLSEDWEVPADAARGGVDELKTKGEPRLYIPNIEDLETAAAYLRRHGA
jgi:hypothetical protein